MEELEVCDIDSNAYSALDYIMNMSFEVEIMKKSIASFAETP